MKTNTIIKCKTCEILARSLKMSRLYDIFSRKLEVCPKDSSIHLLPQ